MFSLLVYARNHDQVLHHLRQPCPLPSSWLYSNIMHDFFFPSRKLPSSKFEGENYV